MDNTVPQSAPSPSSPFKHIGQCCAACAARHDHHDHDHDDHAHDHGHGHGHSHGHAHTAADERKEILLMAVSGLLFVLGMLCEHLFPDLLPQAVVTWGFFALPYALCGWEILKEGWHSLVNRDFFNEFTLMGGASLAAIALGQLPEAVGVMLFYRLGEFMQERAAGNSRRSVEALLATRPTQALELLDDGSTRVRAPESLAVDSRILVRPGEKIPLDGVVLNGESQVDTSPLTGEPRPLRCRPGTEVHAGTINLAGALTIRVTRPFADSSIARVLEMVENAVARKAPTERFITRMARYYTPAVTALATLTALLPPLLGLGTFSEWIYRGLVLLVISCPCALLISIPLGYFGGIGAASRRGILIKGGAVLDALRHVRVAAFDKTGTLTQGIFEVQALLPAPGVSEQELLRTAALAEQHSTHPLARSVLRAAEAAGLDPESLHAAEPGQMREIPGKGVEVRLPDGALLRAGNAALLRDAGIEPQPVDQTGSVVQVARDGRLLGAIVVADRIREESRDALRALRRQGIQTLAMFTGDRQSQARPVADALGMDVLRAGLLPEDKAAALEALGPTQRTFFVGDGINDAPVLATAGIGVAMGGLGAEAAIETADVVILDDNPRRLPELLQIARRTRRIVWQNIVLALGIKGMFMALGIVGLSGLWEAVFADVGVALLAVLNASRAGQLVEEDQEKL